MEIDVTKLIKEDRLIDYSESIAYSGNKDIGTLAWIRACNCTLSFVNNNNRKEFINYFKEFGVWNDLDDWSNNTLNALFIQFVAGDFKGGDNSRMFYSFDDNKYYYYIGS